MTAPSAKSAIRALLRPGIQAAWPMIETLVGSGSQFLPRRTRVRWTETWDRTLDEALEALPPAAGSTRDLYRELVQPTE